METLVLDETETVKTLVSASTIEPSLIKNKILLILDRARETVGESKWDEVEKLGGVSLGEGYLVRIRNLVN